MIRIIMHGFGKNEQMKKQTAIQILQILICLHIFAMTNKIWQFWVLIEFQSMQGTTNNL